MTERNVSYVDVAVIGGGFAGLSTAACLKTYGVKDMVVLEKGKCVGTLWTGGLDTLSMHTPWHGLPNDNNMAVADFPIFKTKGEVCKYLSNYADMYDLKPHIQNSTTVSKLVSIPGDKDGIGGYEWSIETSGGRIRAKNVVVATGLYTTPSIPSEGTNISEYSGTSLHSWNLRNGRDLLDKRVLIVGSGNSAAEAAVESYFGGAASVDILAGSPRHYISKGSMETYYRLLMMYYRAGHFLGLLGPGEHSFDDLLYHMYFGEYCDKFNSKQWCDNQIFEDRFQMLMSTDLSSYGLPVCAPLVFGESAYSRFHVLDGKRKGRRSLPAVSGEAARIEPKEEELGFIDLVKGDKINVLNGNIVGYKGQEVTIDCLLNPAGAKGTTAGTTEAMRQAVSKPYDVVVHASGFTHDLSSWIVDYNKFVRPAGQLDKDLAQARVAYVAARSKSNGLIGKISESGSDAENANKSKSVSVKVPELPCRSNYPLGSPGSRQQYPWVGQHSRSVVQPNLFFVGFDNRKATLSLGYQGWDCGLSITKDLGKFDPSVVPVGSDAAVHSSRHYGQSSHPAFPRVGAESGDFDNTRMKAISRAAFVVSSFGTVALSVVLLRRYRKKTV